MLQFKVGDRVRLSAAAGSRSDMSGTVIGIHERAHNETYPHPLQECVVDFGTHTQYVIGSQLERVKMPARFLLGELLSQWTMLTQKETETCLDDHQKLIRLLQERCGFSRQRAEQELDIFFGEFHDKLRRAA